jgi:hypothetical protein
MERSLYIGACNLAERTRLRRENNKNKDFIITFAKK